ncbi:MAG: ChaN family lipoprotein [Gammaproteobacteria bacterium]|nr:ChaN family lipoprotein [Gammaproteobacteria bacterium]
MCKWMYFLSGLLLSMSVVSVASDEQTKDDKSTATNTWHELSWQAELHHEHPLVGKLWRVTDETFVTWDELRQALPRSGWLLLGEQHDHPDHHQLQRWFIERLASGDNLGNVAMEMISSDQQEAIDQWQGSFDELLPADLQWPERGWPWGHYAQQVTAALRFADRLLAADLSIAEKQSVRADSDQIERLSTSHTEFLAELVVTSHCNLFPSDRADPMVAMQIARDQFMAQQLQRHSVAQKVSVFIAGAGHVRADYGVPVWLPEELPHTTLILQAVSVEEDPREYLNERHNGKQPSDYILFVPALPERDYCAELLEQMQR